MILFIMEGLTEKLAWLYGQYIDADKTKGNDHKTSLVYTQDVNRELASIDPANRNVSYLRITDIDLDVQGQEGQRRHRRLELYGRLDNGSGAERMRVSPCSLRASWILPLHKGVQDYWELIKLVAALKQGEGNFTLVMGLGNEDIKIDIRVVLQGGVPLPPLEGDVQEQQIPQLEVQLFIPNAYIILEKKDDGTYPTLQSITHSVNTTGNPALDGVPTDYTGDDKSIT